MKMLLVVCMAVSFSFAQWGGGGGGKTLNDYQKKSVSGRDIYVYAPADLKENSPLLLSLHDMDQDPNYQQSNTHWEAVADTAGFVVVYPRGGTGMSTWDIQGDKDTKWIVQIIDQMANDYDIDTSRVYLSGFSMGGMFTYHAMSKIADKIAAFVSCSGPNVFGASKVQRPVPIMHIHGTNDDVLNYSMVEDFLKNYRNQFNCPSQAEEEKNYPNAENSGATMYTWGPCDEGVYIKHLKLPGRGHSPSKADVSDIWNFVKEWTVDGRIPEPESSSSSDEPESSSAESSSSVESSSNIAGSSSSEELESSSSVKSSSSIVAGSSSATTALLEHLSPLSVSVSRSSDNSIVVSNALGRSITVFNSLGHTICTVRGTAGVQKVYVEAKGVYIVKVGSRIFKISL